MGALLEMTGPAPPAEMEALKVGAHPRFETVQAVLRALGVKLAVSARGDVCLQARVEGVTTVAQSVSDRRKLDEAQALFDEVDMLRLESRERESVRAMLMLLGEMRFRTLAMREAEAERALVDEIELLGDKVQAYVERYRRERARIYWLRPGRS